MDPVGTESGAERSSGVNWFDTTNAYNKGQAAIALGRILTLASRVFETLRVGARGAFGGKGQQRIPCSFSIMYR